MSTGRLLISYAHPDDESFGLGGLIGKYVEQGVDVYLICATNGDVGTISPEYMNGYQSVAEVRIAELEKAAEILNLKQVFRLGYKDSGMMGAETNKDPACLWAAPVEAVTRQVVQVIREVQPQVIITFNKYGGYGHPDHIAIQRATTDAFTLAGQADYVTDSPPYAPQKLYYSNIPKNQLRMRIAMLRLQGHDPRRMGRNKDMDMQAIVDHAEPSHARVDVRNYFELWDQASNCHASQLNGRSGGMPLWLRKTFFPTQSFTRVFPAPKINKVDEVDLFANVKLDAQV